MQLQSIFTSFYNTLNGLLCLFCIFSVTLTNAQTIVAGPCGTTVTITNASDFTTANGSISISNITGSNVYAYWNNNFTTAIIDGSSYSNPTAIPSIVAGTYPLYFKVFNADFSTVLCEQTVQISVGPKPTCADFPTPTFTFTSTTSTPCTSVEDGTVTLNNLTGPAAIIEAYYGTQTKQPVSGSVTFTGVKKGFQDFYIGYYDSQYGRYCLNRVSVALGPVEICIDGCATDVKAHNYVPTANSNAICLTCNDGVQNGDEVAVDCGGKHCEPCCAADKIAGSVYLDNNQDGEKGIHESKMANITVTAFDENNQVAQTTTGTDGTYAFTGFTASQAYRVEFTNIPSYAYDGVYGSKSGTSVQFVSPNNCSASLGLINAGDYCQAKPDVVTTIFSNGNQIGTGSGIRSVVKSPYGNQGAYDLGSVLPITTQATAAVTGAVYGVAYHRPTKKYITSAYLKRHSGFGSLGIGGLYVTDPATSATSNFVDIGTLGASIGTDPHSGLPSDVTQPSLDALAFSNVSKLGIGDIDFSDDGNDLFAVNMNTRELIKMNVGQTLTIPTSVTNYAITNPGCPNGDFRPFALKYNHGKIYIGITCSAETSQTQSDLSAKVISFDPNNTGAGFTTVLDFPLTYSKGYSDSKMKSFTSQWYPWVDSWNGTIKRRTSNSYPGELIVNRPSPILTDIEFDVDNSMILGIRDRFGDQVGFRNYAPTHTDSLYQTISGGDILRAGNCNFGATWTIENDATVCATQTMGKDTLQGPGGGEYYWGDFFNSGTKVEHADISNGSLAFAPGSGEILATGLDLILPFTGGIYSLNNQTGARVNSLEVYDAQRQYLGKSNGIGDIEVLCNAAPIEIGNRVFMDTDGDGIQDAGEMGLDRVTVELWKAGAKVTEFLTTNGGQWFFTNLDANTDYEVKILAASFPSGKELTGLGAGAAGSPEDMRDNDAKLIASDAVIAYRTGSAGQNNHTLDFGFKAACIKPSTISFIQTEGSCTGSVSNDDAKIDFTGITNADKADKSEGATYTGAVYSAATGIVTGGAVSFTGLKHATPYTYRIFNADKDCFKDTTITTPTKTCVLPCNLTATATGTNTKCNGSSDGTATATAAGNIGAVTYLWSNAATTAAITGLAAGTYTVTVTETASCTATASYVVTEPSVIALTCDRVNVTTVGGSNGEASVVATGGTAPYTYLWDNAAASTTASITGLAAGTYTVTVTDANACIKVCNSTVSAPSAIPCNLLDGGITVSIDEKGTSSTSDDEYVVYANPTGTGLAATYNVSGDINKTGVPYGSIQEVGRTSTANSTISYFLEDAADANCSIADAAYGLNANTCILKANPTVLCSNNGTPNDPSDDTYSVTLNPTGNGIGLTYNVTGGITASGVAYGSAQQIATGLLISAGGVTITVKDATTLNCELINIRIDAPAPCSGNGVAKLDLVKTVDLAQAKVGDNVTYTIVVKNTGTAPSNAIEVTDTLNGNLQFVLASPAAAYNKATGIWTVGVLPIGGSATLTITAKLLAVGVTQNYADITLGGNNDSDGPLNNHDVVCTTVPIELCTGTSFTLSIPNNFTEIQWFKDGVAIVGATTSNLLVSAIGDYTFTSKETLNGCPATGCCPVKVITGTNCCPAKICLGVKVTRK